MLLPSKNCLINVLVSLVEFEQVILLGSTSASQEIIYPVGGRWVGAFSRWVGGRWSVGRWFYNNPAYVNVLLANSDFSDDETYNHGKN